MLLLGVFTSCKDDDEVGIPNNSNNEDAVFYINGIINGTNFDKKAGFSGEFMHTDVTTDQNNINTFKGTFMQEDCSDLCAEAIAFSFQDYDFKDVSDINLLFTSRSFSYRNEEVVASEIDAFIVAFNSEFEDNDERLVWNFGNAEGNLKSDVIFGLADPVFNFNRPSGTFYYPILGVNETDECLRTVASLQKQLPIVPDENIFAVPSKPDLFFELEDLNDGTVKVNLIYDEDQMQISTEFSWFATRDICGENEAQPFVVTTEPFFITEIEDEKDIYMTVLFVDPLDPLGAFTQIDIASLLQIAEDGTPYMASSKWEAGKCTTVEKGSKHAFSTILIEYKDENGKYYSSSLGDQTGDSSFFIAEVEEYETNAQGQKTKKFEVSVDYAKLFAEDGSQVLMEDTKGVIAIAYE